MITDGTVYVSSAPDKRRERPHDVCVMMYNKCICDSPDHCQEPSTRMYSLNDPKLDKCYKELPCPDHNPILLAVQRTIENVRAQYRRGLQEEAT